MRHPTRTWPAVQRARVAIAAILLLSCSGGVEDEPPNDAAVGSSEQSGSHAAGSGAASGSAAGAGLVESRPDAAASAGRESDASTTSKPDASASAPDAAGADAATRDADAGTARQGPSAGCGTAALSGDSANGWMKHDITVMGVAARYLQGGEKYGTQHGYDFTKRNYFVRLPAGYDGSGKSHALVLSGGGCGATDGISGNNGGSNPLPDKQSVAVQVGLSYVYPMGAGACFADGTADTPDLPYFDAVMAEVDKTYCFDRAKVFVSGFSSGAWESYMLGCARGGIIRGIGTQAGGLRKERPPCSNVPIAAFLTAGVNDANPIENIDKTGFDTGSQAARDVILKTNGCTTKDTAAYLTADAPADWNCVSYTGCPKAYPVVWCAITANRGGHGAGSNKAFWPFWNALPGN